MAHPPRSKPPLRSSRISAGGRPPALRPARVPVLGPGRGPGVERLEPKATVIGVRFHPGAAPDALGVPASELLGRTVELASIWGKRASVLAERLADAGSPGQATRVLEVEVTARTAGGGGGAGGGGRRPRR